MTPKSPSSDGHQDEQTRWSQFWNEPGFFNDRSGKRSSTRFVFLVWSTVVLFVWVFLSMKEGRPMELDWGIIVFLAALGGLKLTQSFAEKPGAPAASANPAASGQQESPDARRVIVNEDGTIAGAKDNSGGDPPHTHDEP